MHGSRQVAAKAAVDSKLGLSWDGKRDSKQIMQMYSQHYTACHIHKQEVVSSNWCHNRQMHSERQMPSPYQASSSLHSARFFGW